jgi:hypothetical protein
MEQSLSVGTVNVQAISKGNTKTAPHPNDVQFKVEYSADYKGVKNMPEGIVIISKESAEQFTKAGIGHVVEETKENVVEADNAPMIINVPVEASKESAEQFTKADDNVSSGEKSEDSSKSKSSKSKDKK